MLWARVFQPLLSVLLLICVHVLVLVVILFASVLVVAVWALYGCMIAPVLMFEACISRTMQFCT